MIESKARRAGRILWGVALALLIPGLGLVFARAWGAGVALLVLDTGLGQAALAVSWRWAPLPGPFAAVLGIAAAAVVMRLVAVVVVAWRLHGVRPPARWFQSAWLATAVYLACSAGLDAMQPGFGWRSFSVPSGSMVPTLEVGDRFVADVRGAGERPPYGAVVVFGAPGPEDTVFVKRVVGLPGDRVAVISGHLTINGRPTPQRAEPIVQTAEGEVRRYVETLPGGQTLRMQKMRDDGPFNDTPEFIVPPGNLFVMGDNRDNSLDSRALGVRGGGSFGFVPFPNVLGRAALLFWPPSRALRAVGVIRGAGGDAIEGLADVGEDVIDMLDADGEADVAGADAGGELLLGGELAVGGAGRVDGEGAGVADVGDVVDHLEAVDEGAPGVGAAGQFEAEQAAGAAGEVFGGAFGGEAGVVGGVDDAGDLGPAGQEAGDGGGVAAVLAHAEREGFDALQGEEGVEGGLGRAEVAQQGDAELEGVGDGAEGLGGLDPDGAVVAGVGAVEGGLPGGVGGPVEGAAVDDYAADAGAVAAHVLGGGVHDDGGAVVEGADQERGGGVVHDEGDAEGAAEGGDLGDGGKSSSFGLGRVSAYQARVRPSLARTKPWGSAGSTKRTSMPMSFIVLAKRFQVPP